MKRNSFVTIALLLLCLCQRGQSRSVTTNASGEAGTKQKKIQLKQISAEEYGLHNLLLLTERIYSGSEPHGEKAFKKLAEMGMKVIVSVDGARPQLELAKKYGLR